MDFRGKFLAAIDNAANQAKTLVNGISDSFDEFDFDSHLDYLAERRDALLSKGNSLLKDLGDLLKQVKESFTDFSVTVPFDEASGEKFHWSFDGDKLTIEVTFNDENHSRCNKTTVIVPENCDVKKLTHSVNNVTKSLTITIPKVVEMPKEGGNEQKPRKKKLAKKVVTSAKPAAIKRDSKGRFVKA